MPLPISTLVVVNTSCSRSLCHPQTMLSTNNLEAPILAKFLQL